MNSQNKRRVGRDGTGLIPHTHYRHLKEARKVLDILGQEGAFWKSGGGGKKRGRENNNMGAHPVRGQTGLHVSFLREGGTGG